MQIKNRPLIVTTVVGILLFGTLVLLALGFLFPGPEIHDFPVSSALCPSGKLKATVLERDVGLLNPPSILVTLHAANREPRDEDVLIAMVNGAAPSVRFVSDSHRQVALHGGRENNLITNAMGVTIQYLR